MKRWLVVFAAGLAALMGSSSGAQTSAPAARVVKGPDERFKADILVVVAHPDDEGGVTPYLARAIYDEHKRVAVVYTTRGGSGGNDYTREHGPALADIREQEARQACAKLGISNVWFLDGKDTASQNVLNSLANWGHGANLEALVRIVRLTRPEVIISWLPGIFIGENHADHQASGVLATEAFDLANDPTAFPAQVAGASKRLESYLENLTPWQPKKLYFFSDADDQKQFAGTGPAYSVKQISPSQKKPYWRLAIDAATPHLTQFPAEIHQLSAMRDEQLSQFMDDPQHQWWSEPMTLIFAKAMIPSKRTAEVFEGVTSTALLPSRKGDSQPAGGEANLPEATISLSGPWGFYQAFRVAHGLRELPIAKQDEIAVKAGTLVSIPLEITHPWGKTVEVKLKVTAPEAWKVIAGEGNFSLPEEWFTAVSLEIQSPSLTAEEVKKEQPREVVIGWEVNGKLAGSVKLRTLLRASALPQN
jgi:LmbE family N-acetylglucosaminyl deacetylase